MTECLSAQTQNHKPLPKTRVRHVFDESCGLDRSGSHKLLIFGTSAQLRPSHPLNRKGCNFGGNKLQTSQIKVRSVNKVELHLHMYPDFKLTLDALQRPVFHADGERLTWIHLDQDDL